MQDLANKIVNQGEQIANLNSRVAELSAALSANTETLQNLTTNAGTTVQTTVHIANDSNLDVGPVIPWAQVCKVLRESKMQFFLYHWYDLSFEKSYAALESQDKYRQRASKSRFVSVANFLTGLSTEDVEARPTEQEGDVLEWKKMEAHSESTFCKALEFLTEKGYSQYGVAEIQEVKFNPFFKVLSRYLKNTKKTTSRGQKRKSGVDGAGTK